ncbi:helix-turn-helix domain-containing protein [uncultured Desulfobacter sp.]|uniref:helix-turn-helix domain-containing protein n=1 Tax=uncultured Desulfobacter sp. TaxID=240139 RepID=UPI0029F56903|nr:helix-turn-helix domain-containing protein [uncultured Desulfobacter sp.]
MNEPTNVQIIEQNGVPVFAVIPYEEYIKAFPEKRTDENALIPHEVVSILVDKDCNLVKAWRLHLGFTQKEVAAKAGISQAALSQMEKADNHLRNSTLSKLAAAMNLTVDQLTD